MCMHSLTHSQVALVTSCFVFALVLQLPLFSSCGSRTGKCGVTVMSPDINLYYIGPVLSKYIVVDSVQSRGQTDRCFAIYGLVPAVCLVVCLVVKLSTTVRKDMCAVYVHIQVTIPALKTVLTWREQTRHSIPLLCHGLSTLRDHSLFKPLLTMVEYLKDFLLLDCKVWGL